MGKYRSRLQIIADVLSVVNDGARKTQIMYKANLSYQLLNRYLDETLKLGLINQNSSGVYEVTERGCVFLRLYNDFERKRRELEGQVDSLQNEKRALLKIVMP